MTLRQKSTFENINSLLEQVPSGGDLPDSDSEKKNESFELSEVNFSDFLYTQHTGYRQDSLSRISPEFLPLILAKHQNEFAGRLKIIRATDLEGLEVDPVLDDREPNDPEEEIRGLLQIITKEKIGSLQKDLEKFLRSNGESEYYALCNLQQKISTLGVMFDGLLACTDRQFFGHFQNPNIGQEFFSVKSRLSNLSNQVRKARQEAIRHELFIEDIANSVRSSKNDLNSLVALDSQLEKQIARRVIKSLPENMNQLNIARQIKIEILSLIGAEYEMTKKDHFKMVMLGLRGRFRTWFDYKTLAKRNPNYTSCGVANIALADDFIKFGQDQKSFKLARAFLETKKNSIPESNRDAAIDSFWNEIRSIYDSRSSIDDLLDAFEGRSELLSPAEAMKEVAELTYAMNTGDPGYVLEVVGRLEKKSIDLFHETADFGAYSSILEEGKLCSAWSEGRYTDTFFGGGMYFWGAQQEDWIKGGPEAIHTVFPMKDLFVIRNKYNNPNRAVAAGMDRYDPANFPHSQKKYNILCMIPAYSLKIKKWQEAENYPLSNEGYTANTIADVNDYEVEEGPFIWRCDKHYGHYDTQYFIDKEKEALLKKHLSDDVKVERNITTPGFSSGEYDRLVIPRSVSVLKAASIAYALRVPEVLYQDQLDTLHTKESRLEKEMIEYYQLEAQNNMKERGDEIVKMIGQLGDKEEIPDKERAIIKYFLSQFSNEDLQNLNKELSSVKEQIGTSFPSKEYIQELIPEREWFHHESNIHGTAHILRALINIELLAHLTKSSQAESVGLNIRALEVAASMHDVQRMNDRASDKWHGRRAAEFLKDNSNIFPDLDEETRNLAQSIMRNHSLDDHSDMAIEELIFKDGDALDSFRFGSGPNWSYMRTSMAQEIGNIAYVLANMSIFLTDAGCKRADSVIYSVEALGLFNKKENETLPIKIAKEESGAKERSERSKVGIKLDKIDQLVSAVENAPKSKDLFSKIDTMCEEVNQGVEQRKNEVMSWTKERKRKEAVDSVDRYVLSLLSSDNDFIIRVLSACNQNMPTNSFEKLVESSGDYMKMIIANNPNVASDILDRIAESTNEKKVLDAVKDNQNVSRVTRFKIENRM